MIDPFDIDKFFREFERHIEDAFDNPGGYRHNQSNRNSTYDDFFMEDKDNIYFTVEIGINPNQLEAHIEDDNELVIVIDSGFERIKLPTDVSKVKNITCKNGILDIIIGKKKDGNRKRSGD